MAISKLSLMREEVLRLVRQNDGKLSVSDVKARLGNPDVACSSMVDYMEFNSKVIYTKKIGTKRMLFLNRRTQAADGVPLTEVDCGLMARFNLDILDFKILEAPESESSYGLADRLKVLENQVVARVERSIPLKFKVAKFQEAQEISHHFLINHLPRVLT